MTDPRDPRRRLDFSRLSRHDLEAFSIYASLPAAMQTDVRDLIAEYAERVGLASDAPASARPASAPLAIKRGTSQ